MKSSEIPFDIERGAAKYFHGRDEQLEVFQKALIKTKIKKEGSSILIQGPPGVGKTALLEQFKKIVIGEKWQVVSLDFDALYDRNELFHQIIQKSNQHDLEKSFGLDLKIIKTGIIQKQSQITNHLNRELVRHAPTLFVLDEAQAIAKLSDEKKKIVNFLSQYHNFKTEQGFVFGGLGMTKQILKDYGISRFNPGSVHHLERINRYAERRIIRDWLLKELDIQGNIIPLIDQIIKRTDGWPRHVTSYCHSICNQLQKNEQLTKQKIQWILKEGDDLKQIYYDQRFEGIEKEHCKIIAKTIQQLPNMFSKRQILEAFCEHTDLKTAEY